MDFALTANKTPEQIARDHIDQMLQQAGWVVQDKTKVNISAGPGVAIREFQTTAGPADYVLFVDKKPVGIIEAKREEEGVRLTSVEDQSYEYANAKLKYLNHGPLPFVYESTGTVTRFTDYRDPKPRSRPEFSFHKPETFRKWLKEEQTLRARLLQLPSLPTENLRECQIEAITNLERSFKENRPRALIRMATGSGKTFTAITFIYRLLQPPVRARRILFLVDTKNLGEQAESEFRRYEPQDDNRLFPELYGVTRLSSSFIPDDSQVYISTIQRLYAILKGKELAEQDEEENPNEKRWIPKEPLPVVYNSKVPPEFFDFIVIDECHRSIYNLWRQVLDYFDAFQVGLTATPDKRTLGYFEQNLVCDYGYKQAVADNVLVPYNVFEIQTKVTKDGARLELGEMVAEREKITRKELWNQLDAEVEYTGKQLDNKVVNTNQIRLIARTVRENLPIMFPDRFIGTGRELSDFEVPKMLIFAKSDSHADDIIQIFRQEFAEGNEFCKKITYRTDDPKGTLNRFRMEYYPRIAVTVDMIATGTDIRPLEVLLFMRDVRSSSYYEQMKGRGTRTCSLQELQLTGTSAAKYTKDHFVIIDAIGVERSQKTDSRPLERSPGLSLKEVLESIHYGNKSEDMLTTLANRLIRLEKQINEKEKQGFAVVSGGKTIPQVVKQLLNAYDPDTRDTLETEIRQQKAGDPPAEIEAAIAHHFEELVEQATAVIDLPELRTFVVDVRKKYDQVIDHINPDELVQVGWVADAAAAAESLVSDFRAWIEEHRNEITALQLFYGQPYARRTLTYQLIRDLAETLKAAKPNLAPNAVWRAYEQLEKVEGQPKNELMALVALIRRVSGLDQTLTAYDKTVDRNFQDWVFKQQQGALKYTEEQMAWLRMIKDHVATSFHIARDDFDYVPFNAQGGLGRMWQLFGEETDKLIEELNEVLAA